MATNGEMESQGDCALAFATKLANHYLGGEKLAKKFVTYGKPPWSQLNHYPFYMKYDSIYS